MNQIVRLVNKEEIAKDTYSFLFEKPQDFFHRPGQYVTITLVDPPETDGEGNSRDLSIVSAPCEEHLEFATRVRDTAFKRVLKTMTAGSRVGLAGPFGSFALHSDKTKSAVILAGGIGITPIMSMIRHVIHEKHERKITLFYANHSPADAAYLNELSSYANEYFKLIATFTGLNELESHIQGEKGRITAEMIGKYLDGISVPIFYSAGPPAMVAAMWQLLIKIGVSEDNIRTEEFAGYY